MTSDEIKCIILDIIQKIDEEAKFDELDKNKPLRDQLDLDSMDFLEIVVNLRKHTHIQISKEQEGPLMTVISSVRFRDMPGIVAQLLEAGR